MARVARVCSLEGCERKHKAYGYCDMHYQRMRKSADMQKPAKGSLKDCLQAGCERAHYCKGFCKVHYERMKSGRKMDSPINFHIHEYIDRLGRCWTGGRPNKQGYVQLRSMINGKQVKRQMHSIVMEDYLGRDLLPHENVHHINGVRDDNRLENLELWSKSQPPGQRVEDKIAWAKELLHQHNEHCC